MIDQFDARLDSAGREPIEDARVREALNALVDDRAAASRARPPRRLIPAVALSLTLGTLGAGAAAASQWGPWTWVTEPDIVVAREWFDLKGVRIGSCESHMSLDDLTAEQRDVVRAAVEALDVDSMEPAPEAIASGLLAAGRPDGPRKIRGGRHRR